jgi:hypothetical protein
MGPPPAIITGRGNGRTVLPASSGCQGDLQTNDPQGRSDVPISGGKMPDGVLPDHRRFWGTAPILDSTRIFRKEGRLLRLE